MNFKRMILFVITTFMLFTCAFPLFAEELPVKAIIDEPLAEELSVKAVIDEPPAVLVNGDVNRNGTVDIVDAMLALRMSMNENDNDDPLIAVCADVDGDRAVTAADALIIFRNIVSETELPQNRRLNFLNSLFEQMGKPYVYGGSGPDEFDCSGLVYYCLNQAGYSISRRTAASYAANENWERISSISELEAGDLMFFRQADESNISHVGIYIGNNMLIHASYSNGRVVIATTTNWFTTNFRWGRRVDF